MRVIVSGISGSGRSDAVRELEEYLQKNYPKKKLVVMNTNRLMWSTAQELGMDVKREKMLDLSPPTLQALRSTVFERIIREVEEHEEKHDDIAVIINTHATFRWREHLMPGWDFFYLTKLKPDLFLTIINHLNEIYETLEANPLWRGMNDRKTLGIWQEEEAFTTKLMAEILKKPYYLIARRQPPDTLYKLIFEHEVSEKVYLSYPMTHIRDEEKQREVEELAQELRNLGWVVFDPGTMELQKIHVDIPEEIRRFDFYQTVYRDFQLIDQGTMVVVFYPEVVHSSGVVNEQAYGFRNNKYVFSVFPVENYSPFTGFFSDKTFLTVDELLSFLKEEFIPSRQQ
ncbi:MAG: AAA family ATPase [Candidatus Heimdallarchaeota archaeon]|nr:MAG: AAA family ATPase [Candidatus Heimdallarchaeota archaeon]